MLFNKKGSLIGAILAVTIGILVIHVNFVIFQGLYDAIVRDVTDYNIGNVQITDKIDYIEKSDLSLVNWLERIPYVEAATPRLSAHGEMDVVTNGMLIEEARIPVVGVDPFRDIRASTVHETVADGTYVFSRNTMVLGSVLAEDLGGVQVGDSVKLILIDRWGQEQTKRFTVSGLAESPGGQGFDYSAVIHIDTLRDMLKRPSSSDSILIRLNDPSKALEVKDFFLLSFPNDDFVAQTVEEASEKQLAGFRSGIALINLIGYFGMMSSAFAIVTIQMMLVNGKTKEIGVMRSIGARRKDILIIFIFQGMIIGAIGAGVGTATGLGYTFYAKETKMSFNGSLALEVTYNWEKISQTALLSFLLAIVASLYPSYRATRLLPVEAMRTV
ncbi:MAG: ABC transporter permease [Nitrosopumilus sp. B06]|nr:MAG: ABC transporter permease [Nitrosopumilus sp. D6]RNJ79526.1 MAG: ABC transporter permease [Nitrosopumilus sp. B06]